MVELSKVPRPVTYGLAIMRNVGFGSGDWTLEQHLWFVLVL